MILINWTTNTQAQEVGARVLRPEDPTPFLESNDALTLRQTLGTILDRLSQASAGSVRFSTASDLQDFLTGVKTDVNGVAEGRTSKTRELRQQVNEQVDKIMATATNPAMPTVAASDLEELAKRVSLELAAVTSEGMKVALPSPQSPSKALPASQSASAPPERIISLRIDSPLIR
jgi:hypothetical protein